MADQAVVDLRRMVPLAEDVDMVKVAAAMNPAMSSWVALRRRVPLQGGQSVLILGATIRSQPDPTSPACESSSSPKVLPNLVPAGRSGAARGVGRAARRVSNWAREVRGV